MFKEHRQVPCCGCQKKFRSARSLKDHWHKEAVCNPQKPVTGGGLNIVECGRCDVQFASMDSTAYRAHVAYCHSGLARPKGQPREFTEAEALEALEAVHKEFHEVLCCGCKKVYKRPTALVAHLKHCDSDCPIVKGQENQPEASTEECGHCGAKLSKEEYERHIVESHSGLVKAKGQPQQFTFKEAVKQIERLLGTNRSVPCWGCRKVFKKAILLVTHLKKCSQIRKAVIVDEAAFFETAAAVVEKKKQQRKSCDKSESKQSVMPAASVKKSPGAPKSSSKCGKCDEPFSAYHAARAHSGLARPEGESQSFTDSEINAAVKAAIKLIKTVKCFHCSKGFKTDLGLTLHWLKCGKSKEEIEVRVVDVFRGTRGKLGQNCLEWLFGVRPSYSHL